MVFHDSSLENRTNGRGRVQEYTAIELRQFRLREPGLSHVSEEGIPTLEDVLDLLPLNLWINIHLKGSGLEPGKSWWNRWIKHSSGTSPGDAVARVIATSNRQHQAFLACGPENAAAARQVLPEILLCHNRRSHVENSRFIEEAIASGVRFVQFGEHRPHTAELIAQLELKGIWTTYACADDLVVTRRLLKEGIRFPLADGIHTLAPHFAELGIQRLNFSMAGRCG